MALVPMMVALVVPPEDAIPFKSAVAAVVLSDGLKTPMTNVLMLGVPASAVAARPSMSAVASSQPVPPPEFGTPSVESTTATTSPACAA